MVRVGTPRRPQSLYGRRHVDARAAVDAIGDACGARVAGFHCNGEIGTWGPWLPISQERARTRQVSLRERLQPTSQQHAWRSKVGTPVPRVPHPNALGLMRRAPSKSVRYPRTSSTSLQTLDMYLISPTRPLRAYKSDVAIAGLTYPQEAGDEQKEGLLCVLPLCPHMFVTCVGSLLVSC